MRAVVSNTIAASLLMAVSQRATITTKYVARMDHLDPIGAEPVIFRCALLPRGWFLR